MLSSFSLVGQGLINMGGFKRGGASRSGLCPFSSFLGLSRFFRDFRGTFPIGPFLEKKFPLSRPARSTCKEHSRKGPRHEQDLSKKAKPKKDHQKVSHRITPLALPFCRPQAGAQIPISWKRGFRGPNISLTDNPPFQALKTSTSGIM